MTIPFAKKMAGASVLMELFIGLEQLRPLLWHILKRFHRSYGRYNDYQP
jgi:hypothetical protein